MRSDPDPAFPPEQEIFEEHCAIRVTLSWLEDLGRPDREPLTGDEQAAASAGLRASLASFREHLAQHFRFEEECGVLAAAIMLRPEAEATLARWLEDHARLLALLDGAIARLEPADGGPAPGPEAALPLLADLFERLRSHDAFENELLGNPRLLEFREWQRAYERRDG